MIYRTSYIPGGAGFLNHQQYVQLTEVIRWCEKMICQSVSFWHTYVFFLGLMHIIYTYMIYKFVLVFSDCSVLGSWFDGFVVKKQQVYSGPGPTTSALCVEVWLVVCWWHDLQLLMTICVRLYQPAVKMRILDLEVLTWNLEEMEVTWSDISTSHQTLSRTSTFVHVMDYKNWGSMWVPSEKRHKTRGKVEGYGYSSRVFKHPGC